eukprot:gnl/Hemi2/10151_TR3521_c0_g1_i1.p1 gnl/Hemi2/10151_TR3521_c0_g1~~gnl/Hemi2/10151_TR3521_c0_g1_i1.p1  ORF type:complete len:359 (+),score=114.36 gnl/Hemi2/10151_TR3521_c0_g1_i1:42-1079(+)
MSEAQAEEPATQHSEEEAKDEVEEEEEEEESDWEEKYTFTQSEYWQHFNADGDDSDTDCFDWYSAEELLVQQIVALAKKLRPDAYQDVRVLDVGTGTCPLLFTLAQQHGFRKLTGVDFSERAINFDIRRAAKEQLQIQFDVMDAKNLTFPSASFDIVVDKGCLDCFVNGGSSPEGLAQYLSGLARVLEPAAGCLLVVAVCPADIVHLLATATVRKHTEPPTPLVPVDFFLVKEVWSRDERHLFVCRPCARLQANDSTPATTTTNCVASVAVREAVVPPSCVAADSTATGGVVAVACEKPTAASAEGDGLTGTPSVHCDYCRKVFPAMGTLPKQCSCCNKLHRFVA